MYEIVSSGKNTQWHCFPKFQTKCTYSHIANEPVDIHALPGTNSFLEINKKYGFELLRTYNKDGADIIQRVKKCQLDDVNCGATTTTNVGEIALGLSTGFIRMFNISTGKFLSSKLPPDKIGNSVIGLDYSNCDEYLASLYENGDINTYGLKTGVKMEVFRLDGYSTMIRFHPSKRFYLAAASYHGAATVYDIQSKRKIFQEKAAHSAPCRDISMSPAMPDILVSCAYDCKVNVYDIRKRNVVQQIVQSHPLACVSLSPCGTFMCTGNLKGDIASFDFRNLKEPIDTKRVHDDGGVIRVAFVPTLGDINTSGKSANCSSLIKESTMTSSPSLSFDPMGRMSVGSDCPDAFGKFIDNCIANTADSHQSSPRRDSWLDIGANRISHDFSVDSILSPSRMSLGADHSELRLKRISRSSLNASTPNDFVNMRREQRRSEIPAIAEESYKITNENDTKRPRSNAIEANTANVKTDAVENDDHIPARESNVADQKYAKCSTSKVSVTNKENQPNNQQDIDMLRFMKDYQVSSTPNSNYVQSKGRSDFVSMALSEQGADSFKQMLGDVIDTKLAEFRTSFDTQLASLEQNVLKKVNATENEIKFYQDQYYNFGFSGNFRLFKLMEREIDELKEGMAILLRTDNIAQEYYRLKTENEELKRRLNKNS